MTVRKALPPFTSLVTPVHILTPGVMRGRTIRHTFRPTGSQDWLLISTLAGSGRYRFKGGEFTSQAHDITLYRPGAFQDYQWAPNKRRWDLIFVHFVPRDGWQSWLNWPHQGEGLMRLHLEDPLTRQRVIQRLEEMVHYFQGSQTRRQDLSMNALEEVLLWCDSVNPLNTSAQMDSRIRRTMESLCQDPVTPFSEARLARIAGISGSRLRHLFNKQVGKSMRDFQEQQRLERARQLLALSSQTIGEISEAVGFSNPFYFSLRFKKYTGDNPRGFRQRMQREAR